MPALFYAQSPHATRTSKNTRASALLKFVAVCLLLFSGLAYAATFTASVDKNNITMSDSIILRLELDGSAVGVALNLEELNQNFEILNSVTPQSLMSYQNINGKVTQKTSTNWNILLAPRRKGQLLIPSISINGIASNAIYINVDNKSKTSAKTKPIIVSINAEPSNAVVGQQVLLTLTIEAQSNVTNLDGKEIQVNNAEVTKIDQQSFRKVTNGISWQVHKVSYAIFPEQAGPIIVPPQLYSGVQQKSRNSGYGLLNRNSNRTRVLGRSNALSIPVAPIPDSNGKPWFPALDVVIGTEWSGDKTQLSVGEPISRTIQIQATGQRDKAIPPLQNQPNSGYKSYKDQPKLINQVVDQGLLGVRQEIEAIVPSKKGPLTLPEIRVSWFNTTKQQWLEAVLPEETLNILPAKNQSTVTAVNADDAIQNLDAETLNLSNNDSNIAQQEPLASEPKGLLQRAIVWQIASLILLLILLWSLFIRKSSESAKERQKPVVHVSQNEPQLWKMLLHGAKLARANDRTTLLSYRQQIKAWSLLGAGKNPALNLATKPFDALLFGQSEQSFDDIKQALSEALKEIRDNTNKKQPKKEQELADLYPK